MNSELLTTVPHRDYLDLSIVYYIRPAQTDNGLATLNVTDSPAHTRAWMKKHCFRLPPAIRRCSAEDA